MDFSEPPELTSSVNPLDISNLIKRTNIFDHQKANFIGISLNIHNKWKDETYKTIFKH